MRVARGREPGATVEQIAKDFGVRTLTLHKWLQRVAVDDGTRPGRSRTEGVELRKARMRIRPVEQENEVLRGLRSVAGANRHSPLAFCDAFSGRETQVFSRAQAPDHDRRLLPLGRSAIDCRLLSSRIAG